jgi:hypothetical protein
MVVCFKLGKSMTKLSQFFGIAFLLLITSSISFAQQKNPSKKNPGEKPKMVYLGEFDAGQPNAGIYKLFDPTDEVLCYILMPTTALKKQAEGGVWVYEGNSLGSISCVKVSLKK